MNNLDQTEITLFGSFKFFFIQVYDRFNFVIINYTSHFFIFQTVRRILENNDGLMSIHSIYPMIMQVLCIMEVSTVVYTKGYQQYYQQKIYLLLFVTEPVSVQWTSLEFVVITNVNITNPNLWCHHCS